MRFIRSIRVLVLVLSGSLAVACVTDTEDPVAGDQQNAAVQPPHPYPKPPNHPPTYPGEPCQVCHKPSKPGVYPPPPKPIPGECTGCHNVVPPNDHHNGMYPDVPKMKIPLQPGPMPIPPFCLRCHYIDEPAPAPVDTSTAVLTD